ncbi:hypothetical protein PMAG_a3023 [Pseudoalteromonas mariniglutinosa NCIMB 1770]|uniref:hypothetical protein n=1 Tax=Pseudoalteromonas mariniglutinosa TaxID=206042 RepID=UPI001F1BA785|nr:hypothetical protein [Pseudoalteromonas mariniglutinosa]MCF6144198.1 hypothetical protein [Pseudoalteromonas mariniglutinosa NCIMB 1770]
MSAHFTLSGKIKQVGILALSGGVKKSAISYQLSAISYQLSAISVNKLLDLKLTADG